MATTIKSDEERLSERRSVAFGPRLAGTCSNTSDTIEREEACGPGDLVYTQ